MPKPEHHDCTENKAKEAVNTCHRGMLIWRATEFYGILKSTTCDKLNEKTPIEQKDGPPMKLSLELEDRIKKWMVHMARIGYG